MPGPSEPELAWIGDAHLRVRWPSPAAGAPTLPVLAAHTALRAAALPGLIDITPAASSLLVRFGPATLDAAFATSATLDILQTLRASPDAAPGRLIDIPVCYEAPFAPDLAAVAELCSLSPAQVVELHACAQYVVRFIGFAPGFPYIDGLPAPLNVPRLDAPRPRVPPGSVAIAGTQTCIYPHATPGGWRIIGRTPLHLFDASRPEPALLRMGDRLRFVPISAARFAALHPDPT